MFSRRERVARERGNDARVRDGGVCSDMGLFVRGPDNFSLFSP